MLTRLVLIRELGALPCQFPDEPIYNGRLDGDSNQLCLGYRPASVQGQNVRHTLEPPALESFRPHPLCSGRQHFINKSQ